MKDFFKLLLHPFWIIVDAIKKGWQALHVQALFMAAAALSYFLVMTSAFIGFAAIPIAVIPLAAVILLSPAVFILGSLFGAYIGKGFQKMPKTVLGIVVLSVAATYGVAILLQPYFVSNLMLMTFFALMPVVFLSLAAIFTAISFYVYFKKAPNFESIKSILFFRKDMSVEQERAALDNALEPRSESSDSYDGINKSMLPGGEMSDEKDAALASGEEGVMLDHKHSNDAKTLKLRWSQGEKALSDLSTSWTCQGIIPLKIKAPSAANLTFWIDGVLELINQSERPKKGGSSANKIVIFIPEFPPEYYSIYQELQRKIADKYEKEGNRPNICLDIRGVNRPANSRPDFGYLGGTGPLSDASAFEGIVQEYKSKSGERPLDNFHGIMLSFPPPRGMGAYWSRGRAYFRIQRAFLQYFKPIAVGLLSNTAHTNGGLTWCTRNDETELVNFVSNISDRLVTETQKLSKASVLVLGTKDAAKSKLYQNALDRRGVPYFLPEKNQQGILQEIIDGIKSGKVNKDFPADSKKAEKITYGEKLVEFIVAEVKKQMAQEENITHILLSCTELPMGLHARPAGENKTYLQKLKEQLEEVGFHGKVVDTEHEFVKIIVDHQWKKPTASEVSVSQAEKMDEKLVDGLSNEIDNILNDENPEEILNKLFDSKGEPTKPEIMGLLERVFRKETPGFDENAFLMKLIPRVKLDGDFWLSQFAKYGLEASAEVLALFETASPGKPEEKSVAFIDASPDFVKSDSFGNKLPPVELLTKFNSFSNAEVSVRTLSASDDLEPPVTSIHLVAQGKDPNS